MGLPIEGAATETLYQQGRRYVVQGNYTEAITVMEKAIEMEPDNAHYHHLLGKSYGRLAQQSNWFSAIRLAKKTLHAFERAVELDPSNIEALSDLMEYYKQAPSFLGGHEKKAQQIEERILQLEAGRQAL